jgi:hypothetical protein
MDSELERFIEGFRNEHRAARDAFLGMLDGFRTNDAAKIAELMGAANAGIGPHMRYEEETMYPALVDFLGADYVENMVHDHDRALGIASRLGELAAHRPITSTDTAEAERLIRGLLPHVSDCDGLALFIEKLPEAKQRELVASRERALREGLTMMQWGERRGRSAVTPR